MPKEQVASPGGMSLLARLIAKLKAGLGIVEETNTATHTIASGEYVEWKGDIHRAKAAIPSGTALSSSNLQALNKGGLNDLKVSLNEQIGKFLSSYIIDGTSLATVKSGLINAASSSNIAIEIYALFNDSGFEIYHTYFGFIVRESASIWSVNLVDAYGTHLDIGYINGTWSFNNISEQIANYTEIKNITATDSSSIKTGIISACASLLTMVSTSGMYVVSVSVPGLATLDGYLMKRDNEVTGLLETDGTCYSVAYKPNYSVEVVQIITSTVL